MNKREKWLNYFLANDLLGKKETHAQKLENMTTTEN